MDAIRIETKRIPKIEMNLLAKALVNSVERYFEDPENQAKFEAWRASREKSRETES